MNIYIYIFKKEKNKKTIQWIDGEIRTGKAAILSWDMGPWKNYGWISTFLTGTAPPSWETGGAFQAPRLCSFDLLAMEDSGRLGVVKCAKQISTNKHDKLNWQGVQVSSRKFSGLLKTLQEGQAAIPSPSSPLMKNTHVEDPKQMNPVLSHGFWMYKAEGD